MSQSKVSKIEHARVAVAVADVEAWARATGGDERQVGALVQQAESALTETLSWRSLAHTGLAARQREVQAFEAAATVVRVFEPTIVPGLLQTAEYAQRIFTRFGASAEEIAEAVAARMDRQVVLYDATKRFEFLLPAELLDDVGGPPSLALAQLDRLRNLGTLPNVRLCVVPAPGRAWVWHAHGFQLYEGLQDGIGQVSVELLTVHLNISDPRDVQTYRAAFERLLERAEEGDAVTAAIERALASRAAEAGREEALLRET